MDSGDGGSHAVPLYKVTHRLNPSLSFVYVPAMYVAILTDLSLCASKRTTFATLRSLFLVGHCTRAQVVVLVTIRHSVVCVRFRSRTVTVIGHALILSKASWVSFWVSSLLGFVCLSFSVGRFFPWKTLCLLSMR